jgi:hypothetical protein
VVEYLFSKHKALSSNPTTTNQNREGGREREREEGRKDGQYWKGYEENETLLQC